MVTTMRTSNTILCFIYICTRLGEYVLRVIFNFMEGDLATLLLGMLGDTTQSSHGKFG
jgi:hypothetical protein